jgi:DNA-binding CsgD family transcriptional regulator
MCVMGAHDRSITPPQLTDFGLHLRQAMQQFGSSRLSQREAEIVQLVLVGHCNKSIANLLDISTETVKVHRKRIYTKLGVMTYGGLFSVFFAALAHAPAGLKTDPLAWLPAGFRPAI